MQKSIETLTSDEQTESGSSLSALSVAVKANARMASTFDSWDSRVLQEMENAKREAIQAIRFDGKRILLVDDSPDNLLLFNRILGSAGAKIETAFNGANALEREEVEGPFDAIVMDIRMPIMDGYEATRRIREHGFDGPIIALTAHATPGEEQRCRAAGCDHFHLKPIDRLGLLEAVRAALDPEV